MRTLCKRGEKNCSSIRADVTASYYLQDVSRTYKHAKDSLRQRCIPVSHLEQL